jgi:osmotically-inducible protein OsmY
MMNDSEVKKNVEHELAWDAGLDASTLAVTVSSGVVTLAGTVHNYSEKVEAERAAKRIKGVLGLANQIDVLVGSGERSDAEIAQDAVAALQLQLPVSSASIKTIVDNGNLRLEGQVRWNYLRQRAEDAVRHVRGVKSVRNQIGIEPVAAAKEIRGAIQAAFHRSAQLEANRITIDAVGGDVILNGTVKTWAERDEAERAAWMAPGVVSVHNKIGIGP